MTHDTSNTSDAPRARCILPGLGALLLLLGAIAWQVSLYHEGRLPAWWPYAATPAVFAALIWAFLPRARTAAPVLVDSSATLPRGALLAADAVVALLLAAWAFWTVRGYVLLSWSAPLSSMEADPLPLIRSALRDFWRDGLYPYHFHFVANWELPLTYPPGHWLAFTPAWALKADPRLQSGACLAAAMLLLQGVAWRRCRRRPAAWLLFAAALPVTLWFVLWSPFPILARGQHLAPYWLLVVLWALAVRHRSATASGVLLGALLATRPLFAVVFPIWALWLLRGRRETHPWRSLAACFATGFVLAGAFVLKDPAAYFFGLSEWYEVASRDMIETNPAYLYGLGLTAPLKAAGLFGVKTFAGAALAGLCIAGAVWRMRSPGDLLRWSGLALLLFSACAVIPWYYVYFPPALLLFAALWPEEPSSPPRAARRRLRLGVAASLLFVFATAGGAAIWYGRLAPRYTYQGVRGGPWPGDSWERWRHGWGERATAPDGTAVRDFASSEAETFAPSLTTRWRRLDLSLRYAADPNEAPPPEGLRLALFLNDEFLGEREVPPGAPRFSTAFEIPRGNLFRGLNTIHFSFRTADQPRGLFTPESFADHSGAWALESALFADPLPKRFRPAVDWRAPD